MLGKVVAWRRCYCCTKEILFGVALWKSYGGQGWSEIDAWESLGIEVIWQIM